MRRRYTAWLLYEVIVDLTERDEFGHVRDVYQDWFFAERKIVRIERKKHAQNRTTA